jgi:hypothetical protein
MLPASAAKEAITADGLEPGIASNFREVANIATSLFSREHPHAKLREVVFAPPRGATQGTGSDQVSQADLAGLLARQEARLDLEVVIPGYDTGRMSILVP